MTMHPQRLHRVLRKYRLDKRVARIELANAERERLSLLSTSERLANARSGLAFDPDATSAQELASRSEWADRLSKSSDMIWSAIRRSETTRAEAAIAEARLSQKVERLEARIAEADRAAQAVSSAIPVFRPDRRNQKRTPQ
jgi:multidrug resistance efflux pump